MIYYGKNGFYTENYGTYTLIYYGQTYGIIPKAVELWFIIEKAIVLHVYQSMELIFTVEKLLWYFTENYGTLINYGKTLVLWIKLWYYSIFY